MSKHPMNSRERHSKEIIESSGDIFLTPQVECCGGCRRVDFTTPAGSGRRLPVEIVYSSEGSYGRTQEVTQDFGIRPFKIDYEDLIHNRDKVIRRLRNYRDSH